MTTEAVAAPGNSPPDTGALRALAGLPGGAGVADLSTLVHPRLVPPAVLRPATVADVEALCAMHRRCSPDSRYCRYLVVTKEVGPANVRRLLTETATTVAEALDGQLVAMGNVCLGGAEAELALLVEDGWHRRGLGVCLACVLAGQAVESGARVLTATVIGTNVAIRQTLAAAGLAPVIVAADAGILELHCDLLRWAPAVSPSPGMAAAAVGPPAAAGPDGHPECDQGRPALPGCAAGDRRRPRRGARPPPGRATLPSVAAVAIAAATETTGAPVAKDPKMKVRDERHG